LVVKVVEVARREAGRAEINHQRVIDSLVVEVVVVEGRERPPTSRYDLLVVVEVVDERQGLGG
jgi:hypothetical protein